MATPPFELATDAEGRLVLKREGEPDAVDVRIRRAFPWTEPDSFISVRSKEGKELLLIDALNQLDSRIVQQVRTALGRSSFVPVITKILSIDMRFGYQQWSVETAAGATEFRVQEREDVRFLSEGRFAVKDADGNLYEIPLATSADAGSRKALSAFL
jgi:Domain of unknown function (DUF1854)